MLAASLLILFGALQATDSIPGWRFDNGSGTYAVALDSAVHHAGIRGLRIVTLSSTPVGVGNLMQTIRADQFAGKRVRLSAWVRTADMMGTVQLWLRADARSVMRLDNMADRALGESKEWRRIESVMDVPADAFALAFGVFVRGPGTVWVDHFTLEVVSSDMPTTKVAGEFPLTEAQLNERMARAQTLPVAPVNFDFELPPHSGGAPAQRVPTPTIEPSVQ